MSEIDILVIIEETMDGKCPNIRYVGYSSLGGRTSTDEEIKDEALAQIDKNPECQYEVKEIIDLNSEQFLKLFLKLNGGGRKSGRE